MCTQADFQMDIEYSVGCVSLNEGLFVVVEVVSLWNVHMCMLLGLVCSLIFVRDRGRVRCVAIAVHVCVCVCVCV